MRRFDFGGGLFVRFGRWWLGLVASWPFIVRAPVIAGGVDVTDTFYAGGAFIGYGAQLKVGQGDSPETFVAIPDVESITPGDASTGVVEVTHLRSPDRHKEKKGTIRDHGPFAVTGNYRPDHGAHKTAGGDGFGVGRSLVALNDNVTEANFEIEFPVDGGSTVISFRGLITKYQIGALAIEGKVPFMMDVTPLRSFASLA